MKSSFCLSAKGEKGMIKTTNYLFYIAEMFFMLIFSSRQKFCVSLQTYLKETPAHLFSCEYGKIFKNVYF